MYYLMCSHLIVLFAVIYEPKNILKNILGSLKIYSSDFINLFEKSIALTVKRIDIIQDENRILIFFYVKILSKSLI